MLSRFNHTFTIVSLMLMSLIFCDSTSFLFMSLQNKGTTDQLLYTCYLNCNLESFHPLVRVPGLGELLPEGDQAVGEFLLCQPPNLPHHAAPATTPCLIQGVHLFQPCPQSLTPTHSCTKTTSSTQ